MKSQFEQVARQSFSTQKPSSLTIHLEKGYAHDQFTPFSSSAKIKIKNVGDPGEVPKDDTRTLKQLFERSSATSLSNAMYKFATPAKSTRPGPSSGRASTHSSGRKSSLSEEKVRPKPSRSDQN
ncbi:hypothetical protein L1987_11938 [Smallanthus sonchifolius]|uniref:Uncharacterized protein n=1 Tax=Smallanthus sonchifolius TaxID=185202 RepID=A0ACB9JF12_9ASTR|nr:hypothetical protein L1987_11938 [Smallanthus sonchifolius]